MAHSWRFSAIRVAFGFERGSFSSLTQQRRVPSFARRKAIATQCLHSSVSLPSDYMIVFLVVVLFVVKIGRPGSNESGLHDCFKLRLSPGYSPVARFTREQPQQSSGSIWLSCGTCISRSTATPK